MAKKRKKKSASTAASSKLRAARKGLRSAKTCKLRRSAAMLFLQTTRERLKEGNLTAAQKKRLLGEAKRARRGADRFCEVLHQRVAKAEKNLERAKGLALGGLRGKRRRRRRR